MNKIKVLLLYIVYPLAMGTYFKRALERREDVDLKVCGPFTGTFIPWMGGMELPQKYAKVPNLPLPYRPDVGRVNYEYVKTLLEGWVPDLVLTVDAGINWVSKPQDGFVATVGTDPHVLNYDHARRISDKFFNMQKCYSEKDDIYLPYAYDPTVHFPEGLSPVETFSTGNTLVDTDAVLIGMPYEQRVQLVDELRKHGVSVIFENGPVFDEYRALTNRARIGLNWSSLNDLNARFFETPAFGLAMVANQVPDAHEFLEERVDYLAFTNLNEALESVYFLKDHNRDREEMAERAYKKIQPHTYDARIQQLFEGCGFE